MVAAIPSCVSRVHVTLVNRLNRASEDHPATTRLLAEIRLSLSPALSSTYTSTYTYTYTRHDMSPTANGSRGYLVTVEAVLII